MNASDIILLCATILIVIVVFYVSAAIVAQDWAMTPPYLLRLLVVSLVFAFVVPMVSELGRDQGLANLMLLLSFVFLVAVVRFVMVEELAVPDDWLASMVISLIGVSLIFVIEALSDHLFDLGLPSFI
jgi:predicted ABC-type exoprotein transport system permease subunit